MSTSPASRLLHISASPRGGASESLALAGTFLESFADVHPEIEIETFDLWDGSLPEFGPAAAAAKMAVFAGQQPEGEGARAWQRVRATFDRFDAADRYLFSVPMWNAGVPYILKQFIDVVSQPGMVFGFDPNSGYTGLLQNKKAAVIYTSAVYGVGRPAVVRLGLPATVSAGLAAMEPVSRTSPRSLSDRTWPRPTPRSAGRSRTLRHATPARPSEPRLPAQTRTSDPSGVIASASSSSNQCPPSAR